MLTGKRFDAVFDRGQILESSELTFDSLSLLGGFSFHTLGCNSCRPQSPCYLVMVRDHNRLSCYLLKSRQYGLVKGRASLEADIIANSAPPDHAVEIISNYRIAQASYKLACLRPLLLIVEQVGLHKHRASLAELYRFLALKGQSRKFLVDIYT